MPVSTTAPAVSCSLVLGAQLFADDTRPSTPQVSNEAISERLDHLEEEMATLSARTPSSEDVAHLSHPCCPPPAWSASVDWINWQVRRANAVKFLLAVSEC